MRLCLVKGNCLYFTSDFENQTGDDWDDAPYEHNAGQPYIHNTEILRVCILTPFVSPCTGYLNSPYSVDEINKGKIPWVQAHGLEPIFAGEEYDDVLHKLKCADHIFMFGKHYDELGEFVSEISDARWTEEMKQGKV